MYVKIPYSLKNITLSKQDSISWKNLLELDYNPGCHNDMQKKDSSVKDNSNESQSCQNNRPNEGTLEINSTQSFMWVKHKLIQ